MKYRVARAISVVTKPATVTIDDGVYVREIKEKTFPVGSVLTPAKLKGLDVALLEERGAIEQVFEEGADDAR